MRYLIALLVLFLLSPSPGIAGQYLFSCGPQSIYVDRSRDAQGPQPASASALLFFDTETQESELTIGSRSNELIGRHTWNFDALQYLEEGGVNILLGSISDSDYENFEPYWEFFPDEGSIFISYEAVILRIFNCIDTGEEQSKVEEDPV